MKVLGREMVSASSTTSFVIILMYQAMCLLSLRAQLQCDDDTPAGFLAQPGDDN